MNIYCELYENESAFGKHLFVSHFGAIDPKDGLSFFSIGVSKEKLIAFLEDALLNDNATITIEFDDLTMETR